MEIIVVVIEADAVPASNTKTKAAEVVAAAMMVTDAVMAVGAMRQHWRGWQQ